MLTLYLFYYLISINLHLPHTPRSPTAAAHHYFDEIFTRTKAGLHTRHLRRSSTGRSIGGGMGWASYRSTGDNTAATTPSASASASATDISASMKFSPRPHGAETAEKGYDGGEGYDGNDGMDDEAKATRRASSIGYWDAQMKRSLESRLSRYVSEELERLKTPGAMAMGDGDVEGEFENQVDGAVSRDGYFG